jgi:hypothetical protein
MTMAMMVGDTSIETADFLNQISNDMLEVTHKDGSDRCLLESLLRKKEVEILSIDVGSTVEITCC